MKISGRGIKMHELLQGNIVRKVEECGDLDLVFDVLGFTSDPKILEIIERRVSFPHNDGSFRYWKNHNGWHAKLLDPDTMIYFRRDTLLEVHDATGRYLTSAA